MGKTPPPSGQAVFGQRSEEMRFLLTAYFRRRVDDLSEVEDLVQEVFLRVTGHADIDDPEYFKAYLFRTAASVMADRHRRRSSRRQDQHVVFDPELHGGEAFDPARIMTGRQTLRAATDALADLPEKTRSAFVMIRLDGLKRKAVADQLGISVSAVEKHLVRAMQHIMMQTRDLR